VSSTNRIAGWDVRERKDYKKSPISFISVANDSLTVMKETPTPYQQENVGESKVVRRKSGIKVSSRAVGKKTDQYIYCDFIARVQR